MPKSDYGFIPEVDIINSGGVNKIKNEHFESRVDEDGRVKISRSKEGMEIKAKYLAREIAESEKRLKKYKEIADSYGITDDDIKSAKKANKKDEKKKKEEEEKEEKKKSRLMDPYFSALIGSGSLPKDFAEFVSSGGEDTEKKKKKKKKKKDKEREEIEGLSIKKKKKKDNGKDGEKKKKKESEDDKNRSEVAERFREVEKISRANISEINDTIEFVNERIKDIKENSERMRNKDYLISNYLSTKASLISTKQKIATDIGSNRAKIYEIEMKREKNAKDASANDAEMIARLFPGMVLNGGTKDISEYIDKNGKNKDGKKKKKKKYYDDEDGIIEDSELDKRERKLLESGDLEYSAYDENIEFEGQFTVAIKKSYIDDKWKFVAVDGDGAIIKGFPKSHLPDKSTCHMKFDDEKDIALDMNSNRSYQVFSVPHI